MDRTPRPVIGLLGAVGGGKSAVAAEFARRGARVLDADALVHELYADEAFLGRLARRFGGGVLRPDGTLDRARLAAEVFRDGKRLRALEALVHPPVVARIRAEVARRPRRAPIVLDVPLLLETGLDALCDRLVLVDAPRAVRLERLARGRSLSRAEAARRARFQLPVSEKRRRADAIVDNGGTRARTAAQVRRLWREWVERDRAAATGSAARATRTPASRRTRRP
jgi:dephospho-CoA kinase